MSIGDATFINDSIEAAMNNILKVNFKKIETLKEFYKNGISFLQAVRVRGEQPGERK